MSFLRKKKIGNNYYYYLVKSVRTGPNSWKKYEKYVGRKKPKRQEEPDNSKKYDILIKIVSQGKVKKCIISIRPWVVIQNVEIQPQIGFLTFF